LAEAFCPYQPTDAFWLSQIINLPLSGARLEMTVIATHVGNVRRSMSLLRTITRNDLSTLLYLFFQRFDFARRWEFPFQWNKMRFFARPIDMFGVRDVLLQNVYGVIVPVLKATKGTPIIIDGGANIGTFSMVALNARPDATVYAVEPGRETFAILARNISLNRLPNWHGIYAALWNENAVLRFANARASTSSHIATMDESETLNVDEVPAISLARFCHEHSIENISILKLDIEGAEQAVMESASEVLAHVEHLIVELHLKLVDEKQTRNIIQRHFKYVHDVTQPSQKPMIFASKVFDRIPGAGSE
jgi:FkbM family methyltransferase